jgi:hypothetical protein
MATVHVGMDRGRGETDPILVILYFGRTTNIHDTLQEIKNNE